MRLESRPTKEAHVLARQAADTLVLLNPANGEYYTLDDVGARIWELCDGTRSISEIAVTLCKEYNASPEAVEADALELLTDLSSERLVVDGAAAA